MVAVTDRHREAARRWVASAAPNGRAPIVVDSPADLVALKAWILDVYAAGFAAGEAVAQGGRGGRGADDHNKAL